MASLLFFAQSSKLCILYFRVNEVENIIFMFLLQVIRWVRESAITAYP